MTDAVTAAGDTLGCDTERCHPRGVLLRGADCGFTACTRRD